MKTREIKFRAWDGESMSKNVKTIQELSAEGVNSRDSFKLIWMQYTGLKDKNGKDIYEGDILGLEDVEDKSKCTVVFKDGCFCIMFTVSGEVCYSKFEPWDIKTWIIIGNTCENPDLLV